MTLEEHYQKAVHTPSDIQAHVETLAYYAAMVPDDQLIVELGFRTGVSTWGLLYGGRKVVSYDIATNINAVDHLSAVRESRFTLRVRDSRIPHPLDTNVGLLFLDTLHTYMQLKDELGVWHPRLAPKAFAIFHDTELEQVQEAIRYFHMFQSLDEVHRSDSDHGLIVLQLAK